MAKKTKAKRSHSENGTGGATSGGSGTEHEQSRALAHDLLARGSDLERRLLKRERRAERAVLDAQAALADEEDRLARARSRIERLQGAVAAAADELRQAQAARAAGPTLPAEGRPATGADGRANGASSAPEPDRDGSDDAEEESAAAAKELAVTPPAVAPDETAAKPAARRAAAKGGAGAKPAIGSGAKTAAGRAVRSRTRTASSRPATPPKATRSVS